MKRKNPAAVALGKLGGLKGGLSRSAAKVAAARRNGAKNKSHKSIDTESALGHTAAQR